jgi:hypothetical protein
MRVSEEGGNIPSDHAVPDVSEDRGVSREEKQR